MVYNYDLWYDGQVIHSESGFDSEEDAREDAEIVKESRMGYWEMDGVEFDENLFDIDIVEI